MLNLSSFKSVFGFFELNFYQVQSGPYFPIDDSEAFEFLWPDYIPFAVTNLFSVTGNLLGDSFSSCDSYLAPHFFVIDRARSILKSHIDDRDYLIPVKPLSTVLGFKRKGYIGLLSGDILH